MIKTIFQLGVGIYAIAILTSARARVAQRNMIKRVGLITGLAKPSDEELRAEILGSKQMDALINATLEDAQ